MVRNLYMSNCLPSCPTLFWRKITGPGDENFTASAAAASTGLTSISETTEK